MREWRSRFSVRQAPDRNADAKHHGCIGPYRTHLTAPRRRSDGVAMEPGRQRGRTHGRRWAPVTRGVHATWAGAQLWQLPLCSVFGVKMGCFEELEAATPPETRP